MRICPVCGHRDLPIWRHTAGRLYTDHCHISDLEEWEPELAAEIKAKGYVCKNGVKYKLNRKGTHVHRIACDYCAYPEPSNPRIVEPEKEKHKARLLGKLKCQRTLVLDGDKQP